MSRSGIIAPAGDDLSDNHALMTSDSPYMNNTS